jgi:hypothetical protein
VSSKNRGAEETARGRRKVEGRQGPDCEMQKLQGLESKAKFLTDTGF